MPTFETPEPIVAAVDMAGGRIRIRASDRTDTVVEVRPGDASSDADVQTAERTRVEYSDGRLLVKGPKSTARLFFWRNASVDVTVDLPTDSRVDVQAWADVRSEGRLGDATFDTSAGNVQLGETGRLKLRTAAGDVSVARSAGQADITTAAGKIWLGAVDGTATATTSAGDVTVGEVTGELRLKTAHGDITVDRALAAIDAKTAFGTVRVGEVVRGSVLLNTGWGDVDVGIADGTAAWLDAYARYGGTVRNSLEGAEGPEQSEETVEVRARTGSGDIIIRRA